MDQRPIVGIIPYPSGARKSTIAKKFAKEIKNSAYVGMDYLREIIENGWVNPFSYKGESKNKLIWLQKFIRLNPQFS